MIVLDTSTLILLAKIDLLSIFADKRRLMIPEEVKKEALVKPELYDAKIIDSLIKNKKIEVSDFTDLVSRKKLQKDFGIETAETDALLLAKEKKASIGTDDGPAIKAAKILNIPFFTSIHVLIGLFEKGTLNKKLALAKLENLEKFGRYNPHIIQDVYERIENKE